MAVSNCLTSCFTSRIPMKERPSESQNFFFWPPPAPIASHWRYAAASMARSLLPTLLKSSARASRTFFCLYSSMLSSSSSRFLLLNLKVSILRNGDRPADIPAAIANAALRQPMRLPITKILPTEGGAGMPARCMPRGVKSKVPSGPSPDTAPKLERLSLAASILF